MGVEEDEHMGYKNMEIYEGKKSILLTHKHTLTHSFTSTVPEVVVGGWVMFAEPLQDEFVVQQAVERSQQEDVEGQVANPLLLKVSTQSLHLPTGPEDQRRRREAEFCLDK